MYFQQFPKILYGFDKQDFKPVTDLMIRVKVRDKVLNEIKGEYYFNFNCNIFNDYKN